MNKVELVGRLTKDPELKQTQSGTSVCRFTVAVDRRFKSQDGQRQADFISCVAWRQTAEFVSKYFYKGKEIGVIGSLQTGSYEKDGQTHYTTDVNVDEVEFIGGKADGETGGGTQRPAQKAQAAPPADASLFTDVADSEDVEMLTGAELPF